MKVIFLFENLFVYLQSKRKTMEYISYRERYEVHIRNKWCEKKNEIEYGFVVFDTDTDKTIGKIYKYSRYACMKAAKLNDDFYYSEKAKFESL